MPHDATIASVEDLLATLASDYTSTTQVWFRGQERLDWPLIPSIAREPNRVPIEMTLMKHFQQSALPFLPQRPSTDWDWLFLMQHYGAPTRLLDWSESPLVGLYFAVQPNPAHESSDGCVWCLLPHKMNDIANITPDISIDLPCFGVDEVLDSYLPKTIARERTTRQRPAAAIALRAFPRVTAQLGVFTITHRDQHDIGKEIGDHIQRYIIPADSKAHIRGQLSLLRITQLTLFPELVSVANLTRSIGL